MLLRTVRVELNLAKLNMKYNWAHQEEESIWNLEVLGWKSFVFMKLLLERLQSLRFRQNGRSMMNI